ncbi:MAG: Thioredoxin-dependent 5'-adenylylsulfate reductase [Verrucomicrobia bacterium ADurb.Bin345]|nr:MAG: Thioredoxin-dependent 5'-adenylylsulfate reductase [Verrucomicrobia bacterium ADurb.Bin345]
MTTEQLRVELDGKDPETVIRRAWETFGDALVFATSLAAEDQVITDIIARNAWPIPFVTLDTGRLFPETYALLAETEKRYGIRIRAFFPDSAQVEEMVAGKGVNLFYDSLENRKLCCRVRKLEPLKRALAPYRAWICGLRREQSVTRAAVRVVEDDGANGLTKVNPLAAWSEQEVWGYIAARHVPYNPLHDQGFPSIGCACCTRAVKRTEDVRAGRWWWEQPEHKECGLHGRSQKSGGQTR